MAPKNCLHPDRCMDSYLHGCFYACDNTKLSYKQAKEVQAQKDFDEWMDKWVPPTFKIFVAVMAILWTVLFIGALLGFPDLSVAV